jgi:hypothetical protein
MLASSVGGFSRVGIGEQITLPITGPPEKGIYYEKR